MSKEKIQFMRLLENLGYPQETAESFWNCYDSSEKSLESSGLRNTP
jgi:hypothetical protein